MTGTPIVNRLEDLFSLLSAAILLIIRCPSSSLQAFLRLQAMV
jgi:SNF2 family DNA or RNA helicase